MTKACISAQACVARADTPETPSAVVLPGPADQGFVGSGFIGSPPMACVLSGWPLRSAWARAQPRFADSVHRYDIHCVDIASRYFPTDALELFRSDQH